MKVTFTSDDGSTFDTEEECRRYEAGQLPFQRFMAAMDASYLPTKPQKDRAESMADDPSGKDAGALLYGSLYDWGLEGVWYLRQAIKELAAKSEQAELPEEG